MRSVSQVFVLLVLGLAAPLAWSGDDGWRLEKDKDGIQIYSRTVPGWEIHEIRGVTEVHARLSSVVALLIDAPATHELTEVVASSEIQHRDSDTHYQFYSVTRLPWPVSNRDIFNDRQITQDDRTLTVTIVDTALVGVMPLRSDMVRIVKSRLQWILTPTPGGGVTVDDRVLSDPAGPIPTTLINAMSVSTPFKTLGKLKEMVQRPEYGEARLSFIKDVGGISP